MKIVINMPLLLVDYKFNENKDIYDVVGDDFTGCMRMIDKERGYHITVNDLGYKLKFRCSPTFDITKEKYDQLLKIVKKDAKPVHQYD